MKYLIFTTLAFVLILLGCTKEVKNDLILLGIKGKVKSIRQKDGVAVEKFGEIVIDTNNGYPHDTYLLFSKDGKKIEEIAYDIKGNIVGRKTYDYDNKRNVIKENSFYNDGSSEIEEPFTYDEIGNLIEIKGVFTYKYDTNRNCIESKEYDDGEVDEKITFKYDEKGRITDEDHYNYSGLGLDYYKYKYKYTNEDKSIEKNMYDSEGKLIDKIVQKWTETGITRDPIKYYDYQDDFKFNISSYYKNGTEIENFRYDVEEGVVENEPFEHVIEKFDDKGNVVYYLEDNHEPNKIEYTYDKKGNWTRMLIYDGEEIMKLHLREIVYY
jgi:hypothetical protein